MAKDKKKDKKKKGKKKGSTQQSKEPRTYFPEALLAYQIQIKEEIIDQLLRDIKSLEATNDRNKERNQHLKDEQIGHIRALFLSLKEQEKELEKIEIVTRDDVEKAMKDKWQYVKDQEKLIKDLRSQINYAEQKILQKQAEVDYWQAYKNVGSTEHANQIKCLEEDIKKLKEDLEEMIGELLLCLCFSQGLSQKSRKLFLTQGAGLQIPGNELEHSNSTEAECISLESISELVLAVENKPSEEKTVLEGEKDTHDDGDNVQEDEVYMRGVPCRKFLPPILYEDSKDFKKYKDLGSLEVKLMSIVGQAMPIHEDIKEMPSKAQIEQKYDSGRSTRRITYQMIKSVFP
ncbi:coiled-coil domain-containing protein 83 [Sceloporus undulatus]|uniref:coiled-coil domain-containing protein 83 n=1 Tax=Sceloporus undulatus TaxID=8520 RepID=UPI001C4AD9F7|nr:coiled-coil domain-containing protein 83 [Sceloporus undulatus]